MSTVLDNSRISKHLGQISEYKSTYDPGLLVNEPRSSNRSHINVSDDNLQFVGFDTWNAYEVSGLTYDGLPVAGVAKIRYSCDSKYIVESKSIKLYFNSYNMYQCGNNATDVLHFIQLHAAEDLSKLLETDVSVHIIPAAEANSIEVNNIFDSRYKTLEDTLDLDNIKFDQYQEDASILQYDDQSNQLRGVPTDRTYTKHVHSALLKSNCRVTSQPDWGDVYIYMKGSEKTEPSDLSLLKYIVSFRDECHFHEEICETIYTRLKRSFMPQELCVTCLYARRGGIDINPSRASDVSLLPEELKDVTLLHRKTSKQ